jgi:AcrR family transcriptional regulator
MGQQSLAFPKLMKSDATRAKIEAAAKKLFAQRGYERTSIRAIASAAQIDPSMVIRYFVSKDRLFSRVAEPSLNLGDLANVQTEEIGEYLLSRFVALWEDELGAAGMPVLLRSAASNDVAAQQINSIFQLQVVPAISQIGNPETAAYRAGLISSQLLGVALCRYVLKLAPVAEMDRADLVREVGATIQRYATLDEANSK